MSTRLMENQRGREGELRPRAAPGAQHEAAGNRLSLRADAIVNGETSLFGD